MCAWFALISLEELSARREREVPFLDTFVTIDEHKSGYTVLFEGEVEMVAVVEYGLIIVWHGPDLQNPERPFPELFAESEGDEEHVVFDEAVVDELPSSPLQTG